MTVFADSSALVKLYADEPGHERVRELSTLVVSQLARVEVPSAIWRKQRLGELDAGAARLLTSAFEADWSGTEEERPRFSVVTPTVAVLEGAARLCAVHGLRAYDARAGGVRVGGSGSDPGVPDDRGLRPPPRPRRTSRGCAPGPRTRCALSWPSPAPCAPSG